MVETQDRPQKPVLTPPQGAVPHTASSPLVIILILISLLVLLALSATVIWLLPSKNPMMTEESQPVLTSVTQTDNSVQQQADPAAGEAERYLEAWLKTMAAAEAENIQAWGGDEYAALLTTADTGDRFFQNGEFEAAKAAYQKATRNLEILLSSKEHKLETAIETGQDALENLQADTALSAFQQALLIDPENETARNGSRRAHNLDQVLSLYNEGLQREEHNNIEQARQLFQEAITIDRDFVPASEALNRVNSKFEKLLFQDAMSRTIAALDTGDLRSAEKALAEAAQLRPQDPAMIAARARSAEMARTSELKKLQIKADKLTGTEDWNSVVEVYRKALKIDDKVGFATIGLPEATRRLQLDNALKSIISHPERLQDEGPLLEAQQILTHAKRVDNPGKSLQSQILSLERLVQNASITVEVVLRSDNSTEIEMYHVGRFHPFIEKRIPLKPGTYTVVGRKPGFKDVRLSLKIEADMKMPVFYIHCEEPI